MSFIEVQNISKDFKVNKRSAGIPGMIANMFVPKYEIKHAVKDLSFTIEKGEMVGFIGPNGAGKSSTIKMLSGILCPDSGSITVNGFVPYKQRKSYVGKIGVVFGQKSQLQWDLPVIDSFELLRAIYRIPEDKYKKNLERFTEMLDMKSFINQPVRQLSLGQRMRSDIVASLLHSPEIVFFDEPTIGVDIIGKETIRNFIRELNEQDKVTMIFTTHDMQDIEQTCKRIIIIDKGSLMYDGSLQDIRSKYGTARRLIAEFNEEVAVAPISDVVINELGDRKKSFTFDNNVVDVNKLMHELFGNYSVRDITVAEPEIESIIQKMYNGEV
ncbi:ABC-2 type transport system ATP-binding protein [Treponema bryantii]|jgi:ABC-2 type transport system ATP-binding protein|uniref:ABC-2 type transport system ATP-binding protein n=1 Tax=Treponema bryantii TaxID=163 RepID=A0A1I3IC97_9SPIR|nr:ATP-binding cassette domain-containing protein [Treponema bryantii]SFI45477.1 ABC-2 type transport system ATP-binding protein [Treponema bryantii]